METKIKVITFDAMRYNYAELCKMTPQKREQIARDVMNLGYDFAQITTLKEFEQLFNMGHVDSDNTYIFFQN